MKVLENAAELWNNPQDLIKAWHDMPAKIPRENHILELVNLEDVHSIVDLGCGNGRLFELLKYLHYEYIGYDSSLPMILEAKNSYPEDVDRFSVIDILNFQSGIHYDIAVCQDAAQHYDDPVQFIKTIMNNWSANMYIFSFLVGNEKEDLYNSTVISFSKLLNLLRDIRDSYLYANTYAHIESFDDTEFSWFLLCVYSKS